MKPLKEKKCKIGGELFVPVRPFQPTCFKHAPEWLRKQQAKKWRKEGKEIKEKLKTHGEWENDLQPLINHIARLIDNNQPCISCGGTGKPQGGHYHSIGANNPLRFNLHNVSIQDYYCNVKKGSNKTGYNLGLIKIYGKEYQEYVEYDIVRMYPKIKLSIPELKEIIKIARVIIKELKKLDNTYPPEKRIELKRKYNIELGMFPE